MMRLIRRWVYKLGLRPKPGTVLYSPSAAYRIAAEAGFKAAFPRADNNTTTHPHPEGSPNMSGSWHGTAHVGHTYIITDAILARAAHGDTWFAGRLKSGDLLLCVKHSGDYFYDYALLERNPNGLKVLLPEGVCGYHLGQPTAEQLTARECHLLMAGESIPITQQRMARFILEDTP
jgi:hypothetical protein